MTSRVIYLDNNATTPLSDAAKQALIAAADCYGNPSSLHPSGQEARRLVENAREEILRGLGLRSRQKDGILLFTSCGTEATSQAILGTVYAKERRDATRILTTDSEHSSVTRVMEQLERDGFEVIRIPTKRGVPDQNALRAALNKRILLASFMLVNNETGALYPVGEMLRTVKEAYPDAVTHCDAVQGFMKVPFTPASLCADLISLSAHKLHAPKGIGALYVSSALIKAKKIVPLLRGGGQEMGLRSGTENVPGIAAFGASVADLRGRISQRSEQVQALYDYAAERLTALSLRINRPAEGYVPYTLNLTLPSIKSETMLHALSADGIFVSSGSACSSHSAHPSGALIAFGLTPEEADCSLRISFSEYNTREDVDALCESLERNLERLVRIRH